MTQSTNSTTRMKTTVFYYVLVHNFFTLQNYRRNAFNSYNTIDRSLSTASFLSCALRALHGNYVDRSGCKRPMKFRWRGITKAAWLSLPAKESKSLVVILLILLSPRCLLPMLYTCRAGDGSPRASNQFPAEDDLLLGWLGSLLRL